RRRSWPRRSWPRGSPGTAGAPSARCRPDWTARRSSSATGRGSPRPESPSSSTGRTPAVSRADSKPLSEARDLIPDRPSVAELRAVKPKVLVCLGATAAQAIIGRDFRLSQHRGEFVDTELDPMVAATVHPSTILRAPDDRSRRESMESFVADLRTVARALTGAASTRKAAG